MTKRIYKYISALTLIVLLIFILSAKNSCNSHHTNETSLAKVSEIAKLFGDIHLHPSKLQKQTHNEHTGETASVTRTYESAAGFDEVREFYLEQLTSRGWQLVEERELRDRGRFRGERVLHFQKGEFILSMQFAGNRRHDLRWDYAIRIAYPKDNIKKV